MKQKRIKIQLPDGSIIERTPTFRQCGNFCQGSIMYKGKRYHIGDGDEYLHGSPDTWRLSYSPEHGKYVAYSKEDAVKFKETMIWIDFSEVKP